MVKKKIKKRDPMQLFAEKGDFLNKKRPKRDPKSGLGLLRDPGLPKRDPIGSSASHFLCVYRWIGNQILPHLKFVSGPLEAEPIKLFNPDQNTK